MAALIDAAKTEGYPAEIALVISNRPDAGGLGIAAGAGVKTLTLDHTQYETRAAFEMAVHNALTDHAIDFICCAGFMRILSPAFVTRWSGRIINIHPSLLPKYKGLNTHQRAIDAGDTAHGCSVHWVTAELDAGTVIAQSRVDVLPSDDADTLSERVRAEELTLYPTALERAITGMNAT